jgi:predicted DCC family thiol-disulfide oxidoreductase YuxK
MNRDSSDPDLSRSIVLFDGVCNLCNSCVRFILNRDSGGLFSFSPLQSDISKSILQEFGLSNDSLDTFILVEDGKCYVRSEAALRVARRLGGVWGLFYAFIIIPRPFRDYMYGTVARHRYKWFGKREECMVPEPGDVERFLK